MAKQARDLWDSAMSFDDYVDQMTMNKDRYEENYAKTVVGEENRRRFSGDPLKFLVLTEDFCGDSAQFVPPLGKLANKLDNVEIRLLLRDEHRDFAGQYRRADGYQAIPVIIMLDGEGRKLSFLIERPDRVNQEMAEETRRFAEENSHLDGIKRNYDRMPDETRNAVKQHNLTWRWTRQESWTGILFEDLAVIRSNAYVEQAD